MHRFRHSFSCEGIKAKNSNISCLNAQIWAYGKAWLAEAKGAKRLLSAIRETLEKTGVEISDIVDLKSVAELSALDVAGNYRWDRDIRVIPEFAFLADVPFDTEIKISGERTEYLWCNLEGALQLLEWDSNRQAIMKAEQVVRRLRF